MQALFYPESPLHRQYTLKTLFERLGYAITLDLNDPFDFAVSWMNRTWVPSYAFLDDVALTKPVLNLRCTDISKEYVDTLFNDVFGYSAAIDPMTYRGRAVKKSNENAWGRGRFVECPIRRRRKRYVYQQFIDTTENGLTAEYRTPIILGAIPMVFILRKAMPARVVKTKTQRFDIVDPCEVFTPEECDDILAFCRRIGLDVGELDILRSKHDGRIYILDANKTTVGLPGGGKGLEEEVARLSETFDQGIQALLQAKLIPQKTG